MVNVSTNKPKGLLFGFFGKSTKKGNESIEVNDDRLIFTGGAKYDPIFLDNIKSVTLLQGDELWQEILITRKEGSDFSYHLNADKESLTKAVEQVTKAMGPVQPICKFILSAKQGSLSSRD